MERPVAGNCTGTARLASHLTGTRREGVGKARPEADGPSRQIHGMRRGIQEFNPAPVVRWPGAYLVENQYPFVQGINPGAATRRRVKRGGPEIISKVSISNPVTLYSATER